jgi:hypothetical protein
VLLVVGPVDVVVVLAVVVDIALVPELEHEAVVAFAVEPFAASFLFSYLYCVLVVAISALMLMHHYILQRTLPTDKVILPDVLPFGVTFSANLVVHSAFVASTNEH